MVVSGELPVLEDSYHVHPPSIRLIDKLDIPNSLNFPHDLRMGKMQK